MGLDKLTTRLLPMFPLSVVCGGLELQCLKTHIALKRLGIDAELLDSCNRDDQYDILHLFGSTPNYYDICLHSQGKRRIVVSAVISARSASRLRRFVWNGASAVARVARTQTTHERLRFIYHAADAVMCLNRLESEFIRVTYSVPEGKLHIVTNGVDDICFSAPADLFAEKYGMRGFVLYTGNIVRRKNPLALARVLEEMNVPGVFVGGVMPAEQDYADSFGAVIERSPNLLWVRGMTHDDPLLSSAYAAAAVFCLPSSGETQSLSALEAMAAGRPIILGDYPYAYQPPFEHALRCRPDRPASIRRSIETALAAPENHSVRLPESFTWLNVARATAAVYEEILR